jgi:ATP-dependent Clp protease adaptor protein ClpS
MTDTPTKPAASPQTGTRTDNEPDTKQPWLWNVVLLNDESHTYEYVIRMVQQLFGHGLDRAFGLAQRVDKDGRAICITTHKEHAELKRDQIHAFGRDPLMLTSRGSMSAVIEPAECGGDEDDAGASEP